MSGEREAPVFREPEPLDMTDPVVQRRVATVQRLAGEVEALVKTVSLDHGVDEELQTVIGAGLTLAIDKLTVTWDPTLRLTMIAQLTGAEYQASAQQAEGQPRH